jgi:hypothetical protein
MEDAVVENVNGQRLPEEKLASNERDRRPYAPPEVHDFFQQRVVLLGSGGDTECATPRRLRR